MVARDTHSATPIGTRRTSGGEGEGEGEREDGNGGGRQGGYLLLAVIVVDILATCHARSAQSVGVSCYGGAM